MLAPEKVDFVASLREFSRVATCVFSVWWVPDETELS